MIAINSKKGLAGKYDNKLDPALRSRINRIAGRKSAALRIIVQFKSKMKSSSHRSLKNAISAKQYSRHVPLKMIGSVALKVPAHRIRAICRCKEVKRVFIDRRKRINLNIATPAIGSSAARKSGWTGKGVTIAVLDTGIHRHADLTKPRNRIIAFKDFVGKKTKPYDDNGHGTHCAGDAAGNGFRSNGQYKGAAPEARLVGVKVLDKNGGGYDSTIIQGIEWCVNNRKRYGIRILSLSLGGNATSSCNNDALCQAVNEAVRSGIAVVVAAGNSGPKRGTIQSPGISPLAITVGAADDQGTISGSDDTIASFSSRGPAKGGHSKPDIAAPGVAITSLRVPGSSLDRNNGRSRVGRWYFKLSGTSMAAPLAAGASAQLLQKHPRFSPAQVKRMLMRRAVSLGRNRNAQGKGLINVRFL